MMGLVVDTNIVFSSLTRSRRIKRVLSRLYREGHKLYSLWEMLDELLEHLDELSRYSPLPRRLLHEIIVELLPRMLTLYTADKLPVDVRVRAKAYASRFDPDDWPFIALALHLGVPVWTGDRDMIRDSLAHGGYRTVDTDAVEMLLEGKDWGEVESYLRGRYL